MSTFAAVMTGKGTGAISTIQVFGDGAKAVMKKIFKLAGDKSATFKPGKILVGRIIDGSETIDQVTIGCEQENSFTINCHGNPLIVEMIMQLLGQHQVELIRAEELLTKILSAQENINTIAIEANLAQLKAKTLVGSKIIANQIDAGLGKKTEYWLRNINTISLEQIKSDAERILQTTRTARLIIAGCKTVLIGPPNTGKSTLLNCLCGRQKAIVTDIKGTTRDWVSGQCQIEPLALDLIDTAGLDGKLTAQAHGPIEKQAQEESIRILEQADLVLLVLDANQTVEQIDETLLEKIADKETIVGLNKSDLPGRLDTNKLPESLSNTVQISAKAETGIENLAEKIRQTVGVVNFDLKTADCITSRQQNLLKQLTEAISKAQTQSIITDLLNGRVCV